MKAWERMDLGGGGLQAANIRLARRLKKIHIAYSLWPLFPLGAHAVYLGRPQRALAYAAMSAAAAVVYAASGGSSPAAGLIPLAAAAGLALYDLFFWIPRRVVECNKAIRREVYLSQAPGAPQGFRGRFGPQDPPGGGAPPSFAEQEAWLRAVAKKDTER